MKHESDTDIPIPNVNDLTRAQSIQRSCAISNFKNTALYKFISNEHEKFV
jgi:hypothetical protein